MGLNKFKKSHQRLLDDIDLGKRISPLTAIRTFCLECVGFSTEEVKTCSVNENKETRCPLFYFRLGKNETGKKREKEVITK